MIHVKPWGDKTPAWFHVKRLPDVESLNDG